MANTKVRGVTIEIAGDTSDLKTALNGVNKEIKSTQSQLKDVEKLLKLDPTNTELLKQKQNLLGKEVEETSKKLLELQSAQDKMDAAGVDKCSDQYMALQREIIVTQGEVESLTTASNRCSVVMEQIGTVAAKVASKVETLSTKTRGLSTAAGAALTGILTGAYSSVTNADDLNTWAKQSGLSTELLQELQYAEDLIDVPTTTVVKAATKLKNNMDSTSSEVQEAFETLGVATTYRSTGKTRQIDDVLWETIEALGHVKNETERDQLALTLFGRSADELAGLIDDGGEAFWELAEQAKETGSVLSQDTLDSLNEVNDQIDTLKANLSGDWAQAMATTAEALAPVVEDVCAAIGEAADKLSQVDPQTVESILALLAGLTALSPVLNVLSKIISAVSWLFGTGLPALKGALVPISAWLEGAIGLSLGMVAGIAAVVVAAGIWGEEMKAALQTVDEYLVGVFQKDWTETFGTVIGGQLNTFAEDMEGIWERILLVLNGFIDEARGLFTGDWSRIWSGAKSILHGLLGGMYDDFVWIYGILVDGLNSVITLINAAISGINWLAGTNLGSIDLINYPSSGSVNQTTTGSSGSTKQGSGASFGDTNVSVNVELDGEKVAKKIKTVTSQKAVAYGS